MSIFVDHDTAVYPGFQIWRAIVKSEERCALDFTMSNFLNNQIQLNPRIFKLVIAALQFSTNSYTLISESVKYSYKLGHTQQQFLLKTLERHSKVTLTSVSLDFFFKQYLNKKGVVVFLKAKKVLYTTSGLILFSSLCFSFYLPSGNLPFFLYWIFGIRKSFYFQLLCD